MDIKEKERRLKKSLNMMTETELKEMCFESFLDGLEKGMKIQCIANKAPCERASA